VPTAIFRGNLSPNLPSQRWENEHIKGSTIYVYSKEDGGDHLLMFRNPENFIRDLQAFLDSEGEMSTSRQADSGIEMQELLRTEASWNGSA
jgi:hypothetical protein